MSRPGLPATKGRWFPCYGSRAKGRPLLGWIELFEACGQWMSVPGASRYVVAV